MANWSDDEGSVLTGITRKMLAEAFDWHAEQPVADERHWVDRMANPSFPVLPDREKFHCCLDICSGVSCSRRDSRKAK